MSVFFTLTIDRQIVTSPAITVPFKRRYAADFLAPDFYRAILFRAELQGQNMEQENFSYMHVYVRMKL